MNRVENLSLCSLVIATSSRTDIRDIAEPLDKINFAP